MTIVPFLKDFFKIPLFNSFRCDIYHILDLGTGN